MLFSSTARIQERRALVREMVLPALGILLGLLGPAYLTLALTPDTVVLALYGTKWVGVIPIIVPLALGMPFFGAHALLGPILCGLGRPELEFWPQAISCGAATVAYFIAAGSSATSVAWALFGVMILRFLLIAIFLFRLLKISWLKALVLLSRIGSFSLAFGGAMWGLDRLLQLLHCGPLARVSVMLLVAIGLLGCGIYFAADLVFGRDAVRFLVVYGARLPDKFIRQLQKRV